MLLFLILINQSGFEDQNSNVGEQIIKPKGKFILQIFQSNVDDLIVEISFNVKETIIDDLDRPLVYSLHCRLGQKLPDNSVFSSPENT